MITFEAGNNFCAHCGEVLNERIDDITIRNSKTYHDECLGENLKYHDKENVHGKNS